MARFSCFTHSLVAFADDGRDMTLVTDNSRMFRSSRRHLRRSSKLGLQRRHRPKVRTAERTLDGRLTRRQQLVLRPHLHALDVHAVAAAIPVHSKYTNVSGELAPAKSYLKPFPCIQDTCNVSIENLA